MACVKSGTVKRAGQRQGVKKRHVLEWRLKAGGDDVSASVSECSVSEDQRKWQNATGHHITSLHASSSRSVDV